MQNPKLQKTWSNIKNRCTNKNTHDYKYYGGRGITMCDEWLNKSKPFIEWSLLNGYKEGLTIDRIDNDGNYEPSNCRWVSRKVQSNNQKESILRRYTYAEIAVIKLECNNRECTLAQFADSIGISVSSLQKILKDGFAEANQKEK